jgi:hypothetical protein
VITVEGEGLFHSLVNDIVEARFIGIAELLIEGTDHLFGALDQIIVVQDQVAGRWMRVQISEWVAVPMLGKVYDLILVEILLFWLCEHAPRVVDP